MGLESIFRLIGQYKKEKNDKVLDERDYELRQLAQALEGKRIGVAEGQLSLEQQAQQRLLGMDDAAGSWANRQAFFGNSVQPPPTTPYPQPQGLEAMLPTAQDAMKANMQYGAAPQLQSQELELLGNKGDWFANASPDIQRGLAFGKLADPNALATANQGIEDRSAGVYAANAQQEVAKSLLGANQASTSNQQIDGNRELINKLFSQQLVNSLGKEHLGSIDGVWTNPSYTNGNLNMKTELPMTENSDMMRSMMPPQTVKLSNGMEIPLDPNVRSYGSRPEPQHTSRVAIDSPVAPPEPTSTTGLMGMIPSFEEFGALRQAKDFEEEEMAKANTHNTISKLIGGTLKKPKTYGSDPISKKEVEEARKKRKDK